MAIIKQTRVSHLACISLILLMISCDSAPTIHKLWKFKKREILKQVTAKDSAGVLPVSVDLGLFDLRNSTTLVNTTPDLKSTSVAYEIVDSLIIVNPDLRLRHSFKIAHLSATGLTLIPQNERGGAVALFYEAVEE